MPFAHGPKPSLPGASSPGTAPAGVHAPGQRGGRRVRRADLRTRGRDEVSFQHDIVRGGAPEQTEFADALRKYFAGAADQATLERL